MDKIWTDDEKKILALHVQSWLDKRASQYASNDGVRTRFRHRMGVGGNDFRELLLGKAESHICDRVAKGLIEDGVKDIAVPPKQAKGKRGAAQAEPVHPMLCEDGETLWTDEAKKILALHVALWVEDHTPRYSTGRDRVLKGLRERMGVGASQVQDLLKGRADPHICIVAAKFLTKEGANVFVQPMRMPQPLSQRARIIKPEKVAAPKPAKVPGFEMVCPYDLSVVPQLAEEARLLRAQLGSLVPASELVRTPVISDIQASLHGLEDVLPSIAQPFFTLSQARASLHNVKSCAGTLIREAGALSKGTGQEAEVQSVCSDICALGEKVRKLLERAMPQRRALEGMGREM